MTSLHQTCKPHALFSLKGHQCTDSACLNGAATSCRKSPGENLNCLHCRSFLDGSSEVKFLEDLAADELQLGLALWPCAWFLMEPSRKGPPFQTPHSPIAVPIRIDQASRKISSPALAEPQRDTAKYLLSTGAFRLAALSCLEFAGQPSCKPRTAPDMKSLLAQWLSNASCLRSSKVCQACGSSILMIPMLSGHSCCPDLRI